MMRIALCAIAAVVAATPAVAQLGKTAKRGKVIKDNNIKVD